MDNYSFRLLRLCGRIGSMLLISLVFAACLFSKDEESGDRKEKEEVKAENPKQEQPVTIITNSMDFEGPRELSAGWNTFEYINKSSDVHFFVIEKMPDNRTIEDSKKEVVPVFQEGMDLFKKGEIEKGVAAFGKLPDWYSKVIFMGGPGLISPGKTAYNMVNLTPGYYVYECYVKMPNGKFHTTMGMIDFFEVKNDEVEYQEPENTNKLTVSSEEGFILEDSITSGKQVFEVNFNDQKIYENFLGHDVHLVQLEEAADIKQLEKWMNWANPEGYITPAPEGIIFLGGTQEMPANKTSYFQTDLKPGKHAFIAEIPMASEKNMLLQFEVK